MYGKALFGLLLNAKFTPGSGKKILIVNHGALGDFIHSIPLVHYLKENGYSVDISTKENNKIMSLPIDYKSTEPYTSYDIIFNINAPSTMWFGLFFANTFDFLGEKVYRKRIKKDWVEVHWAEFYIRTAQKLLNLPEPSPMYTISTSNEAIVIHPGGSFSEKSWGIANFVWLATELSKKNKIWVVLGPSEYGLSTHFIPTENLEVVLSRNMTDLFNIMKYSKMFIGNDSGVLHTASLFNIPIFGIYTVGCADTHYPYSNKAVYYFDREQFNAYYKNKLFLKSNLLKEDALKQVNILLEGKFDTIGPNFKNTLSQKGL